jgi:hypothetical protein
VAALCAIDTTVASVGGATDLSVASEICPVRGLTAIFICGAINRSGGRPWALAEHTLALVAYVVVLGSPLTHSCLIVFIGSSVRAILVHCIMRISSSGTR